MALLTPLTADDLRRIAKSLAEWERLLTKRDGTAEYTPRAELVSRIEVTRPDDSELIGHFVLVDGWVGFMPVGDES